MQGPWPRVCISRSLLPLLACCLRLRRLQRLHHYPEMLLVPVSLPFRHRRLLPSLRLPRHMSVQQTHRALRASTRLSLWLGVAA